MPDLTQVLEALAAEDRHTGRSSAMYSAALEIRALRQMLVEMSQGVPGQSLTEEQVAENLAAFLANMHQLHWWAPRGFDA